MSVPTHVRPPFPPYGACESLVITDPLLAGSVSLGQPVATFDTVCWLEDRLSSDLARQASLTLNNTRLTADLQESRRRIVAVRELIHDDPAAADRLLAALIDQAEVTVSEVRRIVHGLRSPALDELGLYGALEVQADGRWHSSASFEERD